MSAADSIVSARVPREIRNQGDAALKRIDSSVTDLVNSAFEYVIQTGSLPAPQKQTQEKGGVVRTFTPSQQAAFDRLQAATSLELPLEFSSISAKEFKRMRLSEKHGVEL